MPGELLLLHPMPCEAWPALMQLPSLLYRMESLLLMREMESMLSSLGAMSPEMQAAAACPAATAELTCDLLAGTTPGASGQLPGGAAAPCKAPRSPEQLNQQLVGKQMPEPGKAHDGVESMCTTDRLDRPAADAAASNSAQASARAAGTVNVGSAALPEDLRISKEAAVAYAASARLPLLMQPLTARHAVEGFSLERFEFLGDAFLKYAASILVYQEHPQVRAANRLQPCLLASAYHCAFVRH